jgi:hypothetical protein
VYPGETFLQKVVAHREAPLPWLANVPPELNATFRRMIAKKPDERQSCMGDVLRDLQDCLSAAREWAKSQPESGPFFAIGKNLSSQGAAAATGNEETVVRTDHPPEASRLRQLLDDGFSVDCVKISLCHKQVSDDDLAELAGMSNLHALDLEGTPITDAGLAHLCGLSTLQRLDLSGTLVSDAGLDQIEPLKGLRRLFLADTAITDAGLLRVKRFTHLDRLSLRGTKITNAGLALVADLRELASLDLSFTRITDKGLIHLKQLTGLEELDLTGTRVSSAGVRALVRALPKTEIML